MDVDVIYFDSAEREYLASASMRDAMQSVGGPIAAVARSRAPIGHPSHGGAASIRAVTDLGPNGWEVRISWDAAHYYLTFVELGTVYMPARPFLRPALTGARI